MYEHNIIQNGRIFIERHKILTNSPQPESHDTIVAKHNILTFSDRSEEKARYQTTGSAQNTKLVSLYRSFS